MALDLTSEEARVLGVMIEKALTTPGQYPMTINGIITGCNQKSNRNPLVAFTEEEVQHAVDRLRGKGLAMELHMEGSRVLKYRHECQTKLGLRAPELAILAELMMRGPQTVGELRGRAGRMHPLESIEVTENVLQNLMNREEPMVERIPPAPGSRAERYVQLLCEGLHPIEVAPAGSSPASAPGTPAPTDAALRARVDALEAEVLALRTYLRTLAESLGETPPPSNDG